MKIEEFQELFEQYMGNKRAEMRTMYNRVLPSGELIFNRFDKGKYLACGENSSVYDTSVVMGDVKIGSHVWVGPYTLLEGSNARLIIGDYVSIDAGVMIYTHDSTAYYVSGGKNDFITGDVIIGSNTVIGTMSMIGCNVTIGEHCVVGAHSFVNKDLPDYSIAAGVPAKVIGKVKIGKDGKAEFVYFTEENI
jgi:acetyltransferase-like isoleucine patch superfamily enzyme